MTSGRLLLLLVVLVAALAQARAAPLDADSCAKLKGEHSQLELAGVELDMAKGPEWAMVNLAPEKLEQIRRFIDVEEQLLFRCRDKSLVHLPPEVDPAPTNEANEHEKKAAAPKAAAPPPGAAKKTKPPAVETKKKPEAGKKAAVQPATKPAAQQTKQDPGVGKAKPPAKAPVKQPADVGVAPAPATATDKGAPKAKADDAYKASPPATK